MKTRAAFNTPVCLQRLKTETLDGEVVNTFENVATVNAAIKPRSSLTIKESDRLSDAASHLVTIDYRADVMGTSRFVLRDGRIFEILGRPRRDSEDRPRYLEMECLELE